MNQIATLTSIKANTIKRVLLDNNPIIKADPPPSSSSGNAQQAMAATIIHGLNFGSSLFIN